MQTTLPDQKNFQEETDSFNLTVAFTDNKLTVTLKDLVSWSIYSKVFTDQNIGLEIHRKMDLIDVYTAFSQTKGQCDEEHMKQREAKLTHVKHYEFGSVIQNQGVPCYKIEKSGKITAYLIIIDKMTKKQTVCQSNLVLAKIRDMSESQIQSHKSYRQKENRLDQLRMQIKKQQSEKESLKLRIIELEAQNKKLSDQLRITKQQLQQQIDQKISTHAHQSEKRLNQVKKQLKDIFQVEIQKINKTNRQLNKVLELQNEQSMNKITELERKLSAMTTPNLHYLSLPQFYGGCFKMEGFKIQYNGTNQKNTHFIFDVPIQYKKSMSFKIKVHKTLNRGIMIGVVDYKKAKDQRSSYSSGHAMCYSGASGKKWPQGTKQENGFEAGDLIEVYVNRSTSIIKYTINDQLKATHYNQMLSDSSKIFMPFVQMHNTGDLVQWVME